MKYDVPTVGVIGACGGELCLIGFNLTYAENRLVNAFNCTHEMPPKGELPANVLVLSF